MVQENFLPKILLPPVSSVMESNRTLLQNHSDNSCYSDSFNLDATAKIGQMLAYIAIFVFSLIGNSLIAMVFHREKGLRTTVDCFILNMAFSDFLFAVTVVPRRITEILSSPQEWHMGGLLGEVLCRTTYIIQDVSTAVSIQSLVIIAVDRFRSIVFPLKPYFITTSIRAILLFLTWVVAFGFHTPYIYTWRLVLQNNQTFCIYSWAPFYKQETVTRAYFLVLSCFLFFIPTVTMICLYCAIIVRLRQGQNTVINYSSNLRNSWNRRNRNVLNTVIAVVIVFILSWLPFNIVVYLFFFSWDSRPSCIARTIASYTVILAHTNNALNPYVIFAFSTNYRDGLRALFCHQKVRPRQTVRTEAKVVSVTDWTKNDQKSHCLQRITASQEQNKVLYDCYDTRL